MLNDDIERIGQESPALLMQKLGVAPSADVHRRAISYVFHAVQQSYAAEKRSIEETRKDTFDYLFGNLEHRSKLFDQFVDITFPDHAPIKRGALSLALICDNALRVSAERDENTFSFGGFDEETIENAVMFFEEAQDLAQYGAKTFSAGIEPESLFLAHINAADALEVILSDYSHADPRILRDLGKVFFTPLNEFLQKDTPIGRHVYFKMNMAQDVICKHLGGYKIGTQYVIPDNENRLEM